jgi:hypothetical protein
LFVVRDALRFNAFGECVSFLWIDPAIAGSTRCASLAFDWRDGCLVLGNDISSASSECAASKREVAQRLGRREVSGVVVVRTCSMVGTLVNAPSHERPPKSV